MLEHIWEKHRDVFRAIAVSVVFDESAAEDVLQDALTKIVRSGKRFQTDGEAFNFIRRTVFNAAVDRYRMVKRHRRRFHLVETLDFETYPASGDTPDPLELLVREEEQGHRSTLMREVRLGLKKLSKEQRQAITLIFECHPKSIKQACRDRGVPYSTVRSRMLTGIDKLRRMFREKGLMGGLEDSRK